MSVLWRENLRLSWSSKSGDVFRFPLVSIVGTVFQQFYFLCGGRTSFLFPGACVLSVCPPCKFEADHLICMLPRHCVSLCLPRLVVGSTVFRTRARYFGMVGNVNSCGGRCSSNVIEKLFPGGFVGSRNAFQQYFGCDGPFLGQQCSFPDPV